MQIATAAASRVGVSASLPASENVDCFCWVISVGSTCPQESHFYSAACRNRGSSESNTGSEVVSFRNAFSGALVGVPN
jgi:hypothetical protein